MTACRRSQSDADPRSSAMPRLGTQSPPGTGPAARIVAIDLVAVRARSKTEMSKVFVQAMVVRK